MFPRRRGILPFLLIAVAAMTGAGCYTLLKHPEITREPDTYDLVERDDWYGCAECHPFPFPDPWPDPWPPPSDGPREWWRRHPPERDIVERDKIIRRGGPEIEPIQPPDPPGIVPGRPIPGDPSDGGRTGKEPPPDDKRKHNDTDDLKRERDQRSRDNADRDRDAARERDSRDEADRKNDRDSERSGDAKQRTNDDRNSGGKSDGERKKGGK